MLLSGFRARLCFHGRANSKERSRQPARFSNAMRKQVRIAVALERVYGRLGRVDGDREGLMSRILFLGTLLFVGPFLSLSWAKDKTEPNLS